MVRIKVLDGGGDGVNDGGSGGGDGVNDDVVVAVVVVMVMVIAWMLIHILMTYLFFLCMWYPAGIQIGEYKSLTVNDVNSIHQLLLTDY